MRNVSVAVQVVAVVVVFAVSAVGQQVLVYPTTSVDLPVEPVHLKIDTTLADAAQRNDFPAFDTLYNESHDTAYAELHDFWQWSLTDPIGAFYGAGMHAKFAAEYPDYSAFIADHQIVDAHGNSFYPSSETRQYLLRHVSARRAAVVATAKPRSTARRWSAARPRAAEPLKSASVPTAEVGRRSTAEVGRRSTAEVGRRSTSIRVPAPLATPVAKPVIRAVPTVPAPLVRHADDARLARGLALIIAGLIGIGMLTLMLRTPAEERPGEEQADPMDSMRIIKLERKSTAKNDPGSHSSVA